jgi:hypothetical protein
MVHTKIRREERPAVAQESIFDSIREFVLGLICQILSLVGLSDLIPGLCEEENDNGATAE